MTKSNGSGKATIQQVYELVDRKIDGLEAKVDKLLQVHAEKIDSLENGQAKMFGGLAVVAAAWSWLFNKFL